MVPPWLDPLARPLAELALPEPPISPEALAPPIRSSLEGLTSERGIDAGSIASPGSLAAPKILSGPTLPMPLEPLAPPVAEPPPPEPVLLVDPLTPPMVMTRRLTIWCEYGRSCSGRN